MYQIIGKKYTYNNNSNNIINNKNPKLIDLTSRMY